MNLDEIDLESLEFEEIGIWPLPIRMVVFVAIIIIVLGGIYLFLIKENIQRYESEINKEQILRKDFKDKYNKSLNLQALKKQNDEIKESLSRILKKLPSEDKMPELLDDISQEAQNAGLEYKLIKPHDPVSRDFYSEQSIDLLLSGNYHGFGKFASGLASLSRVVTLHDFNIERKVVTINNVSKIELKLSIVAKIYWVNPDEEVL